MFRRVILQSNLRPIHHDTENLRCAADALRPVAGTLSPATDQRFVEWQHRRAIRRAEAGRVVRPDQRPRLRPNQFNQSHQPVFRAVANRRENKSVEKALAYGLRRSAQVRSRDPLACVRPAAPKRRHVTSFPRHISSRSRPKYRPTFALDYCCEIPFRPPNVSEVGFWEITIGLRASRLVATTPAGTANSNGPTGWLLG